MEHLLLILEIIGTITGLLYIIQASRLKRNCWIYGFISTAIFAYICYTSKLYVDSSLNVYYVIMAFVGWYTWGKNQEKMPVSKMKVKEFLLVFLLTISLVAFIATPMHLFTDADFPILDSTVGAFAVTATWLSTRKKIENWIFWWLSNSIATVLFFYKGLYFYSALMAIYFILSFTGFVQWKKQLRHA